MRFLTLREYEERKARKEKRRAAARAKRYRVDTLTLTSSACLLVALGFLAGAGLVIASYILMSI